SPSRGSILITSAPKSPSSIVQNGPARNRVRSTTRTPSSGRIALPPAEPGPALFEKRADPLPIVFAVIRLVDERQQVRLGHLSLSQEMLQHQFRAALRQRGQFRQAPGIGARLR